MPAPTTVAAAMNPTLQVRWFLRNPERQADEDLEQSLLAPLEVERVERLMVVTDADGNIDQDVARRIEDDFERKQLAAKKELAARSNHWDQARAFWTDYRWCPWVEERGELIEMYAHDEELCQELVRACGESIDELLNHARNWAEKGLAPFIRACEYARGVRPRLEQMELQELVTTLVTLRSCYTNVRLADSALTLIDPNPIAAHEPNAYLWETPTMFS